VEEWQNEGGVERRGADKTNIRVEGRNTGGRKALARPAAHGRNTLCMGSTGAGVPFPVVFRAWHLQTWGRQARGPKERSQLARLHGAARRRTSAEAYQMGGRGAA
jgi:hypothetical protein